MIHIEAFYAWFSSHIQYVSELSANQPWLWDKRWPATKTCQKELCLKA